MSRTATASPRPTGRVSYPDSRRRWFTIRYLSSCRYPVTISEVSEHVASHVDPEPQAIETALVERDLPELAEHDVVAYDTYTGLVRLADERGTFEKYVRRAINARLVLHLAPPTVVGGSTNG